MIEELARRYTAALGGSGATTLTFDAGQSSEPNFTRLARGRTRRPRSQVEGEIARLTAGPGGDPSLPETAHRRFGDVTAARQ